VNRIEYWFDKILEWYLNAIMLGLILLTILGPFILLALLLWWMP